MNFILRGKRTDPSDPSKAVDKDYLSKNTKARTAERTTSPYFNIDQSFIEPSCRDSRFHNNAQRDYYHSMPAFKNFKKGFSDSSAINWDSLQKDGLGHIRNILRNGDLESICDLQQDYEADTLYEFYSTVFIDQENFDYMIWRTKGQLLCITAPEFAQLFKLPSEANLPRITNTRASRAEIIAKNIED